MEKNLAKIADTMYELEKVARSQIKTHEDYMLVCSSLMAVTRNMYLEALGPQDTMYMFQAVADSVIAAEELIHKFTTEDKPTIH
jgi:hypothetical protein